MTSRGFAASVVMDILRTYPLVIAGGALQQIPFSRRCRFLRPVDDMGWHKNPTPSPLPGGST
jgi:hypothetical protein